VRSYLRIFCPICKINVLPPYAQFCLDNTLLIFFVFPARAPYSFPALALFNVFSAHGFALDHRHHHRRCPPPLISVVIIIFYFALRKLQYYWSACQTQLSTENNEVAYFTLSYRLTYQRLVRPNKLRQIN